MPTINGTNFNGKGKFHKCLVRARVLLPISLIGFSLATVITNPALALMPDGGCGLLDGGIPFCIGGDGGGGASEPPNKPKPKPPICKTKPDLPQCD